MERKQVKLDRLDETVSIIRIMATTVGCEAVVLSMYHRK